MLELHRFVSDDPNRSHLALVRIEADTETGKWCAIATNGSHLIVVRWFVIEVLPYPFFLTKELCKQALRGARVTNEWEGIYHYSEALKHKVVIHQGGNSYQGESDSEQSFPPWRKLLPEMPTEGNDATNLIAFDLTLLGILISYMKKCRLETKKVRWGIPRNPLDPLQIDFLDPLMIEISYILMPIRMN